MRSPPRRHPPLPPKNLRPRPRLNSPRCRVLNKGARGMEERLQKVLAHAGIASRRHAEQIIREGRVTVNGAVITELGTKVDPERDHIKVGGKRVGAPERLVYLAMNKPKDYMSTVMDPEGRPTVIDLLRGVKARVYPVGRLDYASEGLLLLTNDGEFAKRITSAARHVTKTYLVKTNGTLS